MKTTLLTLCILSSISAFATETRIKVSLTGLEYVNEEWKSVKLSDLNPALKKKGLAEFPESLVLGKNDGSKWKAVLQHISLANKSLKRKIEIEESGYYLDYRTPAFCYIGDAAAVVKTLDGLRGSFIEEDMGIPGHRFGSKRIAGNDQYSPDGKEWLAQHGQENPSEVKAWTKYNKASDSVLILSDYGPQGDGMELFATLVPRCK